MTSKSEVGKIGEDLACRYLIGKNYKIIDRNYRRPWGELDIIAIDPAMVLVFVEVKTIRQPTDNECGNSAIQNERCRNIAALTPEDNLTSAKLKKLQRTAQLFAGKHPEFVNEQKGWRIDLLAICLPANKITHYENI